MRTAGTLKALCLALTIPALALAASPPKTIYVDADAPGLHNGTTWTNAFLFVQDGLAAATAGDTIRVAQGIYRPNQATGPVVTDRKATFQLKTGVGIYGGYAGYGTPNPNSRNVALYKTILTGDLDGNDVIVEITNSDLVRQLLNSSTRQGNAYTVVTGSNTEPNAVLDGFIVRGGNANGPSDFPYMYERGGGLFSYKGSPTIRNCTFTANAAASYGGALANYQGHSLIENCTFLGNYSTGGGAGINNWVSDVTILNCTFTWNNVYFQKWGGGIYSRDSKPTIDGCTFTDNYGGMEGGAMSNDNSDAEVTDCQFVNNSADMGGAVENTEASFPTFMRCTFIKNSAVNWGGAMFNYNYSGPTVISCAFIANESTDAGGAVYSRYCQTNITLVNCLFNGNTASQTGGAVGNLDMNGRLINCTFAANFAPLGNAVGCEPGGPTSGSHVTITNGILWDGGSEISVDPDSQVDVTYSDVQGIWPGTGNIHANPLFVDARGADLIAGNEDDNLRLAAHSPCIDAGANYAIPVGVTVDLDGGPRFLDDPTVPNTGSGTPPIVDMGAYEYQVGGPPPGNHAPVANAGPDQIVFAGEDGFALVTLNGSGSYDLDGDPLLYYWAWTIDSFPYQTTGVSPTIYLPLGEHTITLIVFDGTEYSAPDTVDIHVAQNTLPADVMVYPYLLSRTTGSQYVYAIARLVDVYSSDVDLGAMVTITPGGAQAFSQYASQQVDGTVVTTVIGIFHKANVLAGIPMNGLIELTVTGWLKSGQPFAGTDTIWIYP